MRATPQTSPSQPHPSSRPSRPQPTSTSPPSNPTTRAYVEPGTQGYTGPESDLTVYSAANGKVPAGDNCSWTSYKYLDCSAANITLDHVDIEGGIYSRGCGHLTITNSIVDWQPSTSWFLVDDACLSPNSGSTLSVAHSTLETGPSVPTYTGGSDVGGLHEHSGSIPMVVTNSLIRGFPQGLNPTQGSVIKNNEIYVQPASCNDSSGSSPCHMDGLFSEGGNDMIYEGNYIVVAPGAATAAIFFQSDPSSGNRVIANFLKGGAYTFYNETSIGVVVENNTFGGAQYGDATDSGGGNSGTVSIWSGNVHVDGSPVQSP